MLTSFLLSLSSIGLLLGLQILLCQLLQLLTIQDLLDALGLILHVLQHIVQNRCVLNQQTSTQVRFLNSLGASSSRSKVLAQISELDCLLALPLQMRMLLVYSSNQERYSARLESLRLTPELRYSWTLLGFPLLNLEPANLTSTSLTRGEISSSIFWNSSTSFFFLSTYSWILILLFSSSGVSFRIFCFSSLSFLSWSFLALRFWLMSTRLSISWLRTSTQVKRLQFCSSPLMKVFWISRMSVRPVASLMVVKASSMTFMFLWQLSISFTFSLLLTINLVSLCFRTAAVSFWMALISPVLILLPLLSLGSLSSLLSSVSLRQQLVLSSQFFILRLSIKFWLILLVFWLDSMFCMRLLISESAFSISPSSDFRLFWYMVFSCLSRLMAPFRRAISPMVSLYRLSFQVKWMCYDIYLFLEVSHLGEHHLHLSLLALLLQLGHIPLQFLNISVQFRLDTLQSQQISALPLVFLGVVIGLLLHFLGLVDASSRGVHRKALGVLRLGHCSYKFIVQIKRALRDQQKGDHGVRLERIIAPFMPESSPNFGLVMQRQMRALSKAGEREQPYYSLRNYSWISRKSDFLFMIPPLMMMISGERRRVKLRQSWAMQNAMRRHTCESS